MPKGSSPAPIAERAWRPASSQSSTIRSLKPLIAAGVTAWIKALGFVKCGEGFDVTPAAINGFTDLILDLWGDAGRHARSAIGAGELPFGMPVEVEAIVALG